MIDVPSGVEQRVDTPRAGDIRLDRLSLNQRTTANWTLREAINGCLTAGLSSIGVWREPVAEVGLKEAQRMIEGAGLRVSSICRGGFFTDPSTRASAFDSNREAIDEAAALGAATLVLVAGGLPDRDLAGARDRATEALATLVPHARGAGLNLSIEPMHPIFAADRGVISTLGQALDIALRFDAADVGVVVDTFHVWWDPEVLAQIARAGAAGRIASYQIGDWITPFPADSLLSRGMMGDGHIDFALLTAAVVDAGYVGDIEVEIFNAEVWAARGDDVVSTMARRYVELVHPSLRAAESSSSRP